MTAINRFTSQCDFLSNFHQSPMEVDGIEHTLPADDVTMTSCSNVHEIMSSFNGKPQATVGRIRRRLRLAVKRTAAKWEGYFVSDATVPRS